MKKISLENIKQKELVILDNFASFCEQNNLRYFLSYGTLLGAIRHQGFIPWDDDIDVCMPRPDYERFLSLRKKYENDNLQNIIKTCGDNGFPFSFTKIEDKNTIVYENCVTRKKSGGVWIDIFPLDGFKESMTEIQKKFKNERWYKRIIQKSLAIPGITGKTLLRRIINLILIPCAKFYVFLFNLPNKSNNIAKRNNFENCEYVGVLIWNDDKVCNLFKMEDIFPLVKVRFCGKEYSAPKDYEGYLINIYGDYMKLPPENERTAHLAEAWEL